MKTVVILDDSEDVRDELLRRFTIAGWVVYTAKSLHEYRQLAPMFPVNVLIVDLMLPDGSGRSVIGHSGPQVIVFSGDDTPLKGVFAQVTKPHSLGDIVRLAEAAIIR
jgi:DNA-binding response OmpR family regulator